MPLIQVLLALREAGIEVADDDGTAEHSFGLLLHAAIPTLRHFFLLRWRVTRGEPWRDTPDCGRALLATIARHRPNASGDAVRAAIAAGDSARWDVTTLAHALLRSSTLLPYRPLDGGRISDRALVSAIAECRNRVCHAAAADIAAAAAAAAIGLSEELARRYAAAAGPAGPAGPALRQR